MQAFSPRPLICPRIVRALSKPIKAGNGSRSARSGQKRQRAGPISHSYRPKLISYANWRCYKLVPVIQLPISKPDCLTFVAGLGFNLYHWQKRALAHLSIGHPTAIVACNGAGKTSTVLAPAALWCLYTWPLARVVVTSASHSQLEKQFFAELSRYQSHPLF